MNTDNLILRQTENSPLINKEDTLTSAEFDANIIKIYNDLLANNYVSDETLTFSSVRSYVTGEYTTYNGRLWVATTESTGVAPTIDSFEWNDIFPSVLAHEKNKDTILDEGGTNETTVAEIRAFIDAGLTSTTNLSLSTKTATSFKIESSTGSDVTIPQATVVDAGLLNAEDKVKLDNLSGINTGDQTLESLSAEDITNKATDFTTINDALYPTTQAVDTYLTAQVPDLVETFLDSNVELNTNKVTDFTTINDTLYPTTQAVDTYLTAIVPDLVETFIGSGVEVTTNKATTFAVINDTLYPSVKAVDDQLDLKVDSNTAITGATKTKITYDSKGLVTSGADATTSDIADSLNKRYVTDANLTTIGNTSGTNTGDQTFLNARVQSTTSSATVTPTNLNDLVIITEQAVGLTLANPTGTFTEGQALMIRIKDNGTARTIAFDTNYRAIGVTLPTTTVISKTMYLGIIYNSTDTKWDVIGYNIQA